MRTVRPWQVPGVGIPVGIRAQPPHAPEHGDQPAPSRMPSACTVAHLLTGGRVAKDDEVVRLVTAIETASPALVEARNLLDRFVVLISARKAALLDPGLADAARSERAIFAARLAAGKAAAAAAVIPRWSMGRPKGQIIKLKLVKRQMYGLAWCSQDTLNLHAHCARLGIPSELPLYNVSIASVLRRWSVQEIWRTPRGLSSGAFTLHMTSHGQRGEKLPSHCQTRSRQDATVIPLPRTWMPRQACRAMAHAAKASGAGRTAFTASKLTRRPSSARMPCTKSRAICDATSGAGWMAS